MKNVIILHGTGETKNSFWIPYIKSNLETKDYQVSIPQLPNSDNPILTDQLKQALKESFTTETILIGHSSGCPLILTILENIKINVKLSILIAGYAQPLLGNKNNTYNIKDNYDWKKIKSACSEFIFINGVNDPWGANDIQGRFMFDNLGGKLIINNEGHMGSDFYNQPYKEFPFLLKLID